MARVDIIGGGMAGCEAALQLARRGISVRLWEMRPVRNTEAHHSDGLAELVCSNSFRGDDLSNGVGLLKEEMRRAGGALMALAEAARVPAGGAFAVDRDVFSARVTEAVEAESLIEIRREEVTAFPMLDSEVTIVATGPLTSSALADHIIATTGHGQLYFYDAIAPIIDTDSIDFDRVYTASRYGKGGTPDYINCPFTEPEYAAFIEAVRGAELAPVKAFEETKFFEACLPIEVLAERGVETPRFGPMKPVGLTDPRTGEIPHAVVQLRTENRDRTAYNMVGFQSRMKWGEQKRILRTIPGLEDAEFLRFGSVHRNTFIHGPRLLEGAFALRGNSQVRFAGQITGVEGYVESMACGLILGQMLSAELLDVTLDAPPADTALGALRRHVVGELAFDKDAFQPSNINWGMMPPLTGRKIRSRRLKRVRLAERALASIEAWLQTQEAAGVRLPGFANHDIEAALADAAEPRPRRS